VASSPSRRLKLGYVGLAVVDSLLAGSPRPGARRIRRVTKPMLVPTLAAALLTDQDARRSPLRSTTLVAQAAGWGGDVALLGKGTGSFLAGAGSFALGHVAYIAGFRRNGRSRAAVLAAPAPRAIGATWLASGPLLALAASRTQKALGPAVLGYSAVLATMAATSTQLDPAVPEDARRATAAGGALFLISDTLLGLREFVLRSDTPAVESAVMATYTAAQLLLAEGAGRAATR
jgi:uncharacterized membrane protein YhhN